ncbi:hypothetical protein GGC64_002972 [Mycobacterium sp. OAS707]|uniref:hypothetical protein n=1 Tax=Mycobacterium sp. OAS707 TaxID=2663822 RepID=UPI0019DDD6F6|nr:hypothetical protein [Mycobacterium sp. OAS707]MBE1548948.1 hypothetical protein [Mycobacterium sp. OAS707]
MAVAGDVCAALTFGSPDAADSLDGDDAVLPVDGRSAVAAFGGTSAADGGTEPTDAVAEALAVSDTDAGDDGACVAGLGEATVEVTVGVSELGATARGAGASTFVTVGASTFGAGAAGVAVGDAGATTAVVVCVTGAGATGSTTCCVGC